MSSVFASSAFRWNDITLSPRIIIERIIVTFLFMFNFFFELLALNPRERILHCLLRSQRALRNYLRGSKILRSLLRRASIVLKYRFNKLQNQFFFDDYFFRDS